MQPPAEGRKAPAFSGIDQDGKTWTLADFRGRKLALYFYPQDNTPTCTEQACNLRDHYGELQKAGYAVLGVSPDTPEKHRKFIAKFKLPFPLISDPDLKIIQRYHVWGEKQMFGNRYMGLLRTTFVIDEKGIIRKIIRKPRVKQHSVEIIASS
ncbi:MAG: thioredoxin-dependent thiol peroxidase [Chitinophagaceae bacterium]|nr:thioredoxin-dependent thiol peroxidase [Chitinophagaceae bacterium]